MKKVRVFLIVVFASLFIADACYAQTNGNFGRVRLVPKSTITSSDTRNGVIYYNSTANKLRVYQNGGWVDLAPSNSLSSLGSTIIAESYPVQGFTGTAQLVDERVRYTSIYLANPTTITGIKLIATVQGNYTGDNNNRIGLYSYSAGTLTLVASSANDAALWTAPANAVQTIPFSTPYSAAAGVYFVATIYSQSAEVTAPEFLTNTLYTTSQSLLDFPNDGKLYGLVNGQTDIASPTIAMSAITSTTLQMWIALY